MRKRKSKRGGARPGAGRPALPAGEGRGALLKLRVSDDEHARVLRYAATHKTTVSDLIRARLGDVIG